VSGASSWRWVLACVSVALSALVKYTTAIIGLFYLVAWARLAPTWRARAGWFTLTGVIVLAITLALFAPWLDPRSFGPMLDALGGTNYTNSLTDLLALTIADRVVDPQALNRLVVEEDVRDWIKLITKVMFVGYLGWEMWRVWKRSTRPGEAVEAVIEASIRSFLVLLLLVLMWVLAWYYTWPLALATMLGWRRTLTKVVVGFTITTLPVFYFHHYWNTAMPGWVLFLYVGPPLMVPVIEWAWKRWRPSDDRRGEVPKGDTELPQGPVAAFNRG